MKKNDSIFTHALFYFYLLIYFLLFLGDNVTLPYHVFLYLVMPISLIPINLNIHLIGKKSLREIVVPCMMNPFHTFVALNSKVFILTLFFTTFVTLSSIITPKFTIDWAIAILQYYVSILFFILITTRLALFYSEFYRHFFFWLGNLGSINAAINIYDFFYSYHESTSILSIRLKPVFGVVPDHWPTTSALTYSICLISCLGEIVNRETNYKKFLSLISSVILLTVLILSHSRGPVFGSIIALIISIFISLPDHRRMYLWFIIIFSNFYFIIPFIGKDALIRADNQRFDVWKRFWKLAYMRPLLGYGERIEFLVQLESGAWLGHAHNIFLSAFIRGGVGAAISLFLVYFSALIKTYYFAKITSNIIPLALIITIILAGIVDFDQIIFLTDWQWVSFWMPISLAIAAELSLAKIDSD
jgi:hypothetical protein